jgi:hypothetical protein
VLPRNRKMAPQSPNIPAVVEAAPVEAVLPAA